jgi:hypothetical protein
MEILQPQLKDLKIRGLNRFQVWIFVHKADQQQICREKTLYFPVVQPSSAAFCDFNAAKCGDCIRQFRPNESPPPKDAI